MKISYKKPDEVKWLENFIFRKIQEKHPDFPYPVKPKYRDDSANGLTKCIVDFLNYSGWLAERINNTGMKVSTKNGEKWIKGSGLNGTADISAIIKGRSTKIEIKIGADYQKHEQKIYQKKVESAGGIYFIVGNFREFIEKYKNHFCNA